MLKRNIKYTDFNGQEQHEVFYFNLTKAELVELEASYSGGLEDTIKAISESQDIKTLIGIFKELILMAYGEKSADGKQFVKTDDIRQSFASTAAYSELFMQLATDEKAAIEFIQGILPADMVEEVKKQMPLPPPVSGDA